MTGECFSATKEEVGDQRTKTLRGLLGSGPQQALLEGN